MMKNKMKKILYILIGLILASQIASAQGVTNTGDLNNQKFCDSQLCTVVYDAPGNDGKTHTYRLEFDNKGTPNDDSDDTLRTITVDNKSIPYYAYRDSPTKQGPKQGSTEFDFLVNSYVGGGTGKFYSNNRVYDTTKTVFKDPGAKTSGPQLTKCIVTNSYGLPVDFNFSSCVATIFNQVVLRIAAMYLWVAAWFFNFTLSYSLNMGNFLQTVPIVDIGWKVFRDVANLCFIFILLYIAINTILQSSAANTKKLLGTVIIVAVLLNFSLFFTKVVIDSSNILALQFYEKMGGEQTPSISSFINKNMKGGGDKGIAQTFMKGLGLSGIYNAGKSQEGADKEFQAGAWTTVGNVLAVSIGGALLITVTAFVFFAAAFMFLIRTVVLIFVMILAPLAFLSLALPKGAGMWSKWSGMLISQSFFAPIYMMLIYLVVAIVKGNFGSGVDNINAGGTMNLATFLTGNGSAVGTLYVFLVLIAMMLGSLLIAKNMGAVGGDFARNVAGKATFGAGAWLGRQTIGRKAQGLIDNSERLKRWKDGNFVQRSAFNLVDRRAKGTFDVRNSAAVKATEGKVGSLGTAGGAGGFQKETEDQKKRETSLAKTIAIQRKKNELQTAMATQGAGRDAAIQAALNGMSDSEYVELGASVITNPDIVRNARHSQVEASTSEKNEKLNETQKAAIKTSRLQELSNARNGVAGSRTIKQVLDDMSDAEKAALPEEYLMDHRVFMYFNKNTRELIGKSSNLTSVQKQALGNSRSQALLEATGLVPRTATSPAATAVGSLVKIMTGRELFKLHESPAPAPGHDILLRTDVVDNLTVPQLKELAEIDNFTPALRSRIGNYIRTQPTHPSFYYVKQPIVPMGAPAGTPAVAGEGFAQWS